MIRCYLYFSPQKNLLQIGPLGINFRQWTQGLSSYWHGDHRSGYIFFKHIGELRIISLKGEERVVHRPEHTRTRAHTHTPLKT